MNYTAYLVSRYSQKVFEVRLTEGLMTQKYFFFQIPCEILQHCVWFDF